MLRPPAFGALGIVAALAACSPSFPSASPLSVLGAAPDVLIPGAPEAVGLHASLPAVLDSLLRVAIADRVTPGAALAVGRHGRLVHLEGYGRNDWELDAPAVTDSTIYDLASLTKVVATTTAAMILEEEKRLDLDRPVREYLPEFEAPGKEPITVRMLLTHQSGMTTLMLHREAQGHEQYLEKISTHPLRWEPGTHTNYSDWNIITLQFVIERITGQPLDEVLEARVFGPLAMRDTGYNPDPWLKARIAPTEVDTVFRHTHVHGYVHDENAWAMGGVAGHAGLFSSGRDLAVFAQMLLNGGEYNGRRILKPATIARWTAPQGPGSSRALGWDTPSKDSSAGQYFSPRSFGHTGFTGTSLWVDPQKDLFVILLTNRVNPTRQNTRIAPLRRAVADAVQAAVLDARLIAWERLQ